MEVCFKVQHVIQHNYSMSCMYVCMNETALCVCVCVCVCFIYMGLFVSSWESITFE